MPTRDFALAFQALFDRLPHAIVLLDAQRRITAVNPGFTRLFGYEPDEVVGRDPGFFYADPADFQGVGAQSFRQALEHREAIFEIRYLRKDGDFVQRGVVRSASTTMRAHRGDRLHVDVSARHEAEERGRPHAEMAELVIQRTAELAHANEQLARRASLADEANRAKSAFRPT
ncbi:PAS domain S-box protein [Piscinibacter sp.]|uniref:PAS domain S-box protein n=1 Tax=Piscinibacter sp. TaxID=1903157 RepID=UPI001D3EAA1E|nr:PAS domain S-box protein [Piscinibacter sp.]MBK7529620.1 PAS domain S-box protein [Piscinibacter sp.]